MKDDDDDEMVLATIGRVEVCTRFNDVVAPICVFFDIKLEL